MFLKYAYPEIIVITIEMETATTVIPLIPVPAQIIKIGANAVFGSAFNTTKNGSKILAINSFHHNIIAIISPSAVPITKPKIVSSVEILMCFHNSPF